jgi:hypothetical protein
MIAFSQHAPTNQQLKQFLNNQNITKPEGEFVLKLVKKKPHVEKLQRFRGHKLLMD